MNVVEQESSDRAHRPSAGAFESVPRYDVVVQTVRHNVCSAGGTKAEQVAKGRVAARKDKSEHIIKNRDGSISERNSYGGDPHPPKG